MFNYAALWGPLNEQHELYEHRRVLLLASSSSDSLNFIVTIANRLTEIQRQLNPLDLNVHEPSMFIRNKQLSSAESISQESAFEICYTPPATLVQ